MLYLKRSSWHADSSWIKLRSGRKAEYESIHHFRALESDEDMEQSSFSLRKSVLAARQRICDFLNGSRTEGQKSEGRACLWCPRERKWRTENTEQTARLPLRKPRHPASPSQGPLDTFPPAALRKQTRHCAESSSVRAPGEYGRAPSTGCLLLNIRSHFVWTSSKHIPKAGYSQGLTTPCMCRRSDRMAVQKWDEQYWEKRSVLNLSASLVATEMPPWQKT